MEEILGEGEDSWSRMRARGGGIEWAIVGRGVRERGREEWGARQGDLTR